MLAELSSEIQDIVARVRPSVVTVGAGGARPRTGIVVADGEVLTIAMEATAGESVTVYAGENEIGATVTAFDPASGLALLGAPGVGKPVAVAADLPALGEVTISVAAPIPGDYEARLSIIRCVGGSTRLHGGRRVGSYLQTDAARFRGFSGSLVVNHLGEAIGITMPASRREEAFLLPAGEVMQIVEELRSGEKVGTGYLGVQTTSARLPVAVGDSDRGLLVTSVEDDSPAHSAGLAVGTFITMVGNTRVTGVEDLYDALTGLRAGSTLPITVANSDGEARTLDVEVVLRG